MAAATTEPARLLRAKDKTPSNTLPCPLDNRCPDFCCNKWHNLSRSRRFDDQGNLRPASELDKLPTPSSAPAVRYRTNNDSGSNSDPNDPPRKNCPHCQRPGHTHDDCWKLHPERRPNNLPPNVNRAR